MVKYLLVLLMVSQQLVSAQTCTFFLSVQPSSSHSVNRKTNVNKYTCIIARYSESDTVQITGERGKGATFSKGAVTLVANEFDCGVNIITKDFQKTINTEQFPSIVIDFITFGQEPTF